MNVIRASNPDEGLYSIIQNLHDDNVETVQTDSRNGPVLRFAEPTTVVWEKPLQRVSFCPVRDANPIFHLFEAFWMLAGEEDAARPAYFAGHLASFANEKGVMEGAYGNRWIHHFGRDQLHEYIIPSLKNNLSDRRCVLAMWDGDTDITNGLKGGKDLCCNLDATFDASSGSLNMTVFNRSNDIVYGATGANVVHFSFLQEYIAGALGISVGKYFQVSSNFHLYKENEASKKCVERYLEGNSVALAGDYRGEMVPLYEPGVPIFEEQSRLRHDISGLVDEYRCFEFEFHSSFFKKVVAPCVRAFNLYKDDRLEQAIHELGGQLQSDWVIATTNWLIRRAAIRNKKIASFLLSEGKTLEGFRKTVAATWPSAVWTESEEGVGSFRAEVFDGSRRLLNTVASVDKDIYTIKGRRE